MKKKTVPVSVIIPCYKSSDTIERAVESIKNQSVHPLEIIIVDDFSDDDKTYRVLEKIKDNNNFIKLILLEKNAGPGSARNRGWEIAKGNYIAFLDSDDAWHPKKIELQYGFMDKNQNVDLTGHNSEVYSQETKEHDNTIRGITYNKFRFLIKNRLPTRSVMLKKDLPFRFEENKRRAEDFLLWATLYLNKFKIVKLDICLAYSFKADFGEKGLTEDLNSMLIGIKNTFNSLYKNKWITKKEYILLLTFSYIKNFRRKVIILTRQKRTE